MTRAIGTAQKRVETHNFEIRKHLLEYDDVMNKQREVVYGMRRQILEGESQEETVREWMDEIAGRHRRRATRPAARTRRTGISAGLGEALHRQFDVRLPADAVTREVASREALDEVLGEAVQARYAAREAELVARTSLRTARAAWVMLPRDRPASGRTTCCPWTT